MSYEMNLKTKFSITRHSNLNCLVVVPIKNRP